MKKALFLTTSLLLTQVAATTTATASTLSTPPSTNNEYSALLHNIPDMNNDDLDASMAFAENAGKQQQQQQQPQNMRFQEAQTQEDPPPADTTDAADTTDTADTDEESPTATSTPPMTDDEITSLKAQGIPDTEIAMEQGTSTHTVLFTTVLPMNYTGAPREEVFTANPDCFLRVLISLFLYSLLPHIQPKEKLSKTK